MRLASLMVLLALVACDRRLGSPPPPSEFLIAAGDSTFWITSGKSGISVRGAPIALARFDGRLYELYVTDDDRSYYDAIMIGQRIYRRDLLTGDSTAVVEDTTVARLATAYAVAHPGERQLEPREEASDDPELYATADLEIVAVHGPYLSFEHHADIGLPDGSEIHSIRRGVVDLRTSAPQSVGALFGEPEGTRVLVAARRAFASGIDSLLASPDSEAQAVARAIRDLRLDPLSFAVARIGAEPAVSFMAPGEGEWALELGVPMTPFPVTPPPWWKEIRPTLPASITGSTDEIWDRPGTRVVARLDPDRDLVTLVLRDSAEQEWKAARVPAPVERIMWLDVPPIDSVSRIGLRRAFDDAALYAAETRMASASTPAPGATVVFRLATYHAGRQPPPRRAGGLARSRVRMSGTPARGAAGLSGPP
jgi:hypothetical protein